MNNTLLFDLETTGLSGITDRITCISCKIFGEDNIVSFSGDFESKIISDFAQFVGQNDVGKLVAYNGWSFDIPFLRLRAMANSVNLPYIFWNDSLLEDPFYVLCRAKHGKQVEVAKLVGVSDDVLFGNGKECLDWFEKGDFSKIQKHCESDIVALDKIYSRMVNCGWIK